MAKQYKRHPISGVFSQTKASVVGTGITTRKTETVTYYYAREREDGVLEVQTLGDQVVFGPVMELDLDEFLAQYMPEPQMSQIRAQTETVRQGEIRKAVARGDKFFQQGKTFSAEFEYSKALALDVENVRANFGIGLCYIAREETDKARVVLGRLLQLEAAFENKHKHLFNEFGIRLRMAHMDAEALSYYTKALEISPDDENLHYNMARAALDMGEAEEAAQHLERCLALNPGHAEAKKFVNFLKRKKDTGA